MSTPTSKHLLLFRTNDWERGLSPEELQDVADRWMAWFKRLSAEGLVLGGHPLEETGKLVSGRGGQTVSDGPFTESKEAIGGYFMLADCTFEQALAIAKQNPALEHGLIVEVRPIADACPTFQRAGVHLSAAEA
ncbi:MAG: YciI family protein [Chthoniobacterales bacterium]